MRILLDRESLESALPDSPRCPVAEVVPTNVGCQQPLHPEAQVTVFARPEHEVEVIGHHAPPQEAHGNPLARRRYETHELSIVLEIVKDAVLSVSAADSVKAETTNGQAPGSWPVISSEEGRGTN
jgi:hypothetical protein